MSEKRTALLGTSSGLTMVATALLGALCPPLAPVLVPAGAIGATVLAMKADQESNSPSSKRKKRKEKEMLPIRLSSRPVYYEPLSSSSYIPSENPVTTIARSSPRLAAETLLHLSLDETHRRIVGPAAEEFARQGRGTFAVTTRRKGLFSSSVTTIIKPI